LAGAFQYGNIFGNDKCGSQAKTRSTGPSIVCILGRNPPKARASKPARSLCDAAKAADKGGHARSDNLGRFLRNIVDSFHLHFFLIGEVLAPG
jgi:hypothetical protein